MSEAQTVSVWRRHRGVTISTISSYAFAWFFANEIRTINPNGVLQQGVNGEVVRLPAFAYGFNVIALTLFFVGIALIVAGLLIATSFAHHYTIAQKARAFARSSAIYAALMGIGVLVGQLMQRGYL